MCSLASLLNATARRFGFAASRIGCAVCAAQIVVRPSDNVTSLMRQEMRRLLPNEVLGSLNSDRVV
jgi:arginyl-tRNA--protein-N-Asp/Glu arginylyltransferase